MSGSQKKPFINSIGTAIQNRIADAIQKTGQALPCSMVSKIGSIAVIKFEVTGFPTLPQVRLPIAGSEYIRQPLQPGCRGVVFAADARLGGVTGLGGGVATLGQPANLSALVFFPLGNINFSTVDPDTLVMYGEPNVEIRNKSGTMVILINDTGVFINGINFLTHTHQVIAVGAPTGPPIP